MDLVLAGMVPVIMAQGTIGDLTVTATTLILTGTAGIGGMAAIIGGSQLTDGESHVIYGTGH